MGLKTKVTAGKDFDAELPPAGQHIAVCVAVIDLGTHTEKGFQGAPDEDVHKLYIAWELVEESTRPVAKADYRVSLHVKSKLRQTIKSWRGGTDLADGEEFDPRILLGKGCQLTIEHKKSGDNTYDKVVSVTALAKGMKAKTPEKAPFAWDMDIEGAGGKSPDLPDWLPFLYGKSIEEWITTAHERGGKPVASAAAPATANASPQSSGQHTERDAVPAGAGASEEILW